MKELQSVSWQVVLDEAQNIKNPEASSVSAAVAILISDCADWNAVENRLQELWSI